MRKMTCISRKAILLSLMSLLSASLQAYDNVSADTIYYNNVENGYHPKFYDRLSYELRFNPGKVLSLDEYTDKWLKDDKTYSAAIELHYLPLKYGEKPTTESQRYAADYGCPTFSFGLRYNFNHGTTMHREEDPSWGQALPVDYYSRLGDVVTLYSRFSRPLWRIPVGNSKLTISYYLGCGIGYSFTTYDKGNNIDNEFIGSNLNIYFTGGAEAVLEIPHNWGISAGLDFSHHSNGALYRPNKGSNYLGPFIGLVYYPTREEYSASLPTDKQKTQYTYGITEFRKQLFLEFSMGLGAKTLLEEWQRTQFYTSPEEAEYRTEDFSVYAALSFQADLMYRYARRWASGIGIDAFYGSYSNRVKALDEAAGIAERHSPWSVGVAAKHEVFYNNLSLRIGLGYYLFRHMGHSAKEIEKPYYERVGLHYSFPSLNNLAVGFNVNAHLTKADFTEIQISYPIKL